MAKAPLATRAVHVADYEVVGVLPALALERHIHWSDRDGSQMRGWDGWVPELQACVKWPLAAEGAAAPEMGTVDKTSRAGGMWTLRTGEARPAS